MDMMRLRPFAEDLLGSYRVEIPMVNTTATSLNILLRIDGTI